MSRAEPPLGPDDLRLIKAIAQVLSKPGGPEDCLNEPLFPALLFSTERKEEMAKVVRLEEQVYEPRLSDDRSSIVYDSVPSNPVPSVALLLERVSFEPWDCKECEAPWFWYLYLGAGVIWEHCHLIRTATFAPGPLPTQIVIPPRQMLLARMSSTQFGSECVNPPKWPEGKPLPSLRAHFRWLSREEEESFLP